MQHGDINKLPMEPNEMAYQALQTGFDNTVETREYVYIITLQVDVGRVESYSGTIDIPRGSTKADIETSS